MQVSHTMFIPLMHISVLVDAGFYHYWKFEFVYTVFFFIEHYPLK